MGKRHGVPMQEIVTTNGHQIELPIHINCRSRPKYNKSINLKVRYGPATRSCDLLKQIEQYVATELHKETCIDFEIVSFSKKSFINKKVVLNEYKTKTWLKSDLQYEPITNYKQKDIARKGVHITIKPVDEESSHHLDWDQESEEDSDHYEMQAIRNPLQTLSVQTINNKKPLLLKPEKTLDERLKELCKNADVAFSNFDDIIYNLRKKEELLYLGVDENYIENTQSSITWNMRIVLVDWLYDLQTDLKLHDETLFAAINYIDLFLSKCVISRQHLQLLGVTAIMIASKTYEIIPQPISEWIYLAHDQYTRKQIINLEKKMLRLINWNVFQVTPYNYINPWLQVLEIKDQSKEKFIIDLLIQCVPLNRMFLEVKMSKLVTAVFYLCSIYLNSKFSMKLLSDISKYNAIESKSINNIIMQMHQILINLLQKGGKDSVTTAVYRKFTDKNKLEKKYGVFVDVKTFQFDYIFNQYQRKM